MQLHPGSLAHPHPNSQTHSPELAIAMWKGRDEEKYYLLSTGIVPDTVTLHFSECSQDPALDPSSHTGPIHQWPSSRPGMSAWEPSPSSFHNQSYLTLTPPCPETQPPTQFWCQFSLEARRPQDISLRVQGHKVGAGSPASRPTA